MLLRIVLQVTAVDNKPESMRLYRAHATQTRSQQVSNNSESPDSRSVILLMSYIFAESTLLTSQEPAS